MGWGVGGGLVGGVGVGGCAYVFDSDNARA